MAALGNGAAGVVWALQQLQRADMVDVSLNLPPVVDGLLAHSRRYGSTAGTGPQSYLLGEAGVLLLQWFQKLFGREWMHLGAGHGFAGNLHAFVRGACWRPQSMSMVPSSTPPRTACHRVW